MGGSSTYSVFFDLKFQLHSIASMIDTNSV